MTQDLSHSLLGQHWTNLSSYSVIEVCFGLRVADSGISRYIYLFCHPNVLLPTWKVRIRSLFGILLLLAVHFPSLTELEPAREATQQFSPAPFKRQHNRLSQGRHHFAVTKIRWFEKYSTKCQSVDMVC
jgi:hypothetical protein